MAESTESRIDRSTLVFMTMLGIFFAYLIIKGVQLPKSVMIAGSLCAGILFFFKGMEKPEYVTYLLVAYLPFSRELAGDFGGFAKALNFTNLLMIFLVWVWLTGRYAQGEPLWVKSSLNVPVILFILVGCMSIARGTYYGGGYILDAIVEYKRWITPIFLYFLVLNTVKSRVMIKNVAIIIMVVTTIAGLMAIYDYIDRGPRGSLERSRIGGIADQANQLAAFFNYYMFLPFGFFLQNMKRFRYWLLWIPFLICFRGIMVTFSRGGYLAFAVALYAITFFRSKVLMLILLVFTYVVYMNPILIPAGIRYRMGQTIVKNTNWAEASPEFKEANLEASAKTRVEIWRAGMQMIKDQPMWGIGYGLFPLMARHYNAPAMDAHNTYVILAAEMGIPALLIFLWCVFGVFWQTYRLFRKTNDPFARALALGMLGGLFGLLVSNMFGSRLSAQEISSYFWILAALIVRLRFLDRKDAATGETEAKQTSGPEENDRRQGRGKLDACWME